MAAKLAECISLDELALFTPITHQLLFFVEYLRGSCTLRKLALNLYDEKLSQSVDIRALARALQSNGVPLTHLNLCFFLHGDEIAVVLSEVLESNTTLTHLCLTFTEDKPADPIGPSGASALARALSKNSTLKCLLLGRNSIEDEGAKRFADALQTNSTLTQLDLYENSIGASGTKAICKALQSNHVMTLLILGGNTIGDSGADALAGALQSPATQLSHLDLAHCNITSPGVESLAGALQTNRSLTYLRLKASNISCSVTALAEALRLNRTLTHLDLSASNIGALGTEVICMALQSNHAVTCLILGDNTVGDSGAVALADVLQSPATQLSYLHIAGCNITYLGVEILAGALQTNRSLTHLSLSRSSISCSAIALAAALQLNRTLTHLDLSFNQISDTEAIELAQTLLDKNNSLAYLDLIRNNIGAEGKAKLKLINGKRCVIRF
ncbi:PREDICTED: protein NLRC3-like [Acropora digitifera]|uniref:protein NLRC3-like n=1 Tax=Acropora digitifera TaxID=70779 RepID=UPI00077B1C62|nr:PREDICTED: protein NLRC3-like [Acropora digitifera]